ncbi:putative rhomboid protease [Ascosphaera aggregata]|nr:putative rhomboid protease [Ascosphaera aggregata]
MSSIGCPIINACSAPIGHNAVVEPSHAHSEPLHRLNTYVFIHNGFFHAVLNMIALTPLLERFEAEHGTLTTVALFLGRFYLLVEGVILKRDAGVVGASVWVFLLFASEVIKTWKSHPHFALGTYHIPTWTTPLIACVLVSIFISNVSFLGHIAGILVGYLYGLGLLKFLVPPEKVLRYVEGKLNLLGRLPHYVSVDQKTYGRYGILPTNNSDSASDAGASIPMNGGVRLGP